MALTRKGFRGIEGTLFTGYAASGQNNKSRTCADRINEASPGGTNTPLEQSLPFTFNAQAKVATGKIPERIDPILFVGGNGIGRNSIVKSAKLRLAFGGPDGTVSKLHIALYPGYNWLTGQSSDGQVAKQYRWFSMGDVDPRYAPRTNLHEPNLYVDVEDSGASSIFTSDAFSVALNSLLGGRLAFRQEDDPFGSTVLDRGFGQKITFGDLSSSTGLLAQVTLALRLSAIIASNDTELRCRLYRWDEEAERPSGIYAESTNTIAVSTLTVGTFTNSIFSFNNVPVSTGQTLLVAIEPDDLDEYPAFAGGFVPGNGVLATHLEVGYSRNGTDPDLFMWASSLNTGNFTRSAFASTSTAPQLYSGLSGETIQDQPLALQIVNLPPADEIFEGAIFEVALSNDFCAQLTNVIADPAWDTNQGFLIYLSLGNNSGTSGRLLIQATNQPLLDGVGSGLLLNLRSKRVHIT